MSRSLARSPAGQGRGRESRELPRRWGPARTSRARPKLGRGEAAATPLALSSLPGPKSPGNQKTGLVTREQKLYRTDDTVRGSRVLPRLSLSLAAVARRPHSSRTSRNPRLPASKMAPGYRLGSKAGPVKVPARRKRRHSGSCSFLYEASLKMASWVIGSRATEARGRDVLSPDRDGSPKVTFHQSFVVNSQEISRKPVFNQSLYND